MSSSYFKTQTQLVNDINRLTQFLLEYDESIRYEQTYHFLLELLLLYFNHIPTIVFFTATETIEHNNMHLYARRYIYILLQVKYTILLIENNNQLTHFVIRQFVRWFKMMIWWFNSCPHHFNDGLATCERPSYSKTTRYVVGYKKQNYIYLNTLYEYSTQFFF